jgi:hypothetical protein
VRKIIYTTTETTVFAFIKSLVAISNFSSKKSHMKSRQPNKQKGQLISILQWANYIIIFSAFSFDCLVFSHRWGKLYLKEHFAVLGSSILLSFRNISIGSPLFLNLNSSLFTESNSNIHLTFPIPSINSCPFFNFVSHKSGSFWFFHSLNYLISFVKS